MLARAFDRACGVVFATEQRGARIVRSVALAWAGGFTSLAFFL